MAGFCAAPCCSAAADSEPQAPLMNQTDVFKESVEVEERKIEATKLPAMRVEKQGGSEAQEEPAKPMTPAPEVEEKAKDDSLKAKEAENDGKNESERPKTEVPASSAEDNASETSKTTLWVYKPCNGKMIEVRREPEITGEKAGVRMCPGDAFNVVEERNGEQNILFLKLADSRGWLFDQKPGVGVMCMRKEDADAWDEQQRLQQQQNPTTGNENTEPGAMLSSSSEKPKAGCKCVLQ